MNERVQYGAGLTRIIGWTAVCWTHCHVTTRWVSFAELPPESNHMYVIIYQYNLRVAVRISPTRICYTPIGCSFIYWRFTGLSGDLFSCLGRRVRPNVFANTVDVSLPR